MASENAQLVGNYWVIQKPTDHTYFGSAKNQTESAHGAYDFVNLWKKVAMLFGDFELGKTFGEYTKVSAFPYFWSLLFGFKEKCEEFFTGAKSFYNCMKFTHDTCELSAMALYTAEMIVRPATDAILNAATVLNLCSDVPEIYTYGQDAYDAHDALQVDGLTPAVQSALASKRTYSLIKTTKAFFASAVGYFSVHTIATTKAVVKATTALGISLIPSIANLTAYYYKNLRAESFADRVIRVA